MKLYKIHSYLIIAILLICSTGYSQTAGDSIIMSALHDELYRNYQLLSDNDTEKPFFIAYTVADARYVHISSSLGALNRTQDQRHKDWHVRLMVGDYEINDENFISSQPQDMVFRPTIEMPVENDYLGIRRSLWLTTNNVFHAARNSFKNKMLLIENKQITEADLEIDDFSRAPVVKERFYADEPVIDKVLLEKNIRNLSDLFNNEPEIYSSSVDLTVFTSTVYFINSEGSEIQFPLNMCSLTVQASSMTEDSESLNKNIVYLAATPDELPAWESVEEDINTFIDNILELRNTPRFEDDYYGPVIIADEVAAETLEGFLFKGSDALIAFRESLQSGSQQSVFYERNDNSLQTKIGKPILSKDLTITAKPYLNEYNGVKLLGNFLVDAEGVRPPEQLVLVEHGKLQTLLNGRTPSRQVPTSNGHMRFHLSMRGLNKQVGPGVIHIEAENSIDRERMKLELITMAKEAGQEYAMMIRSLDIGGASKPFNYYLIDVNTGEEKLTRAVRLSRLTMQALRRNPKFSNTELVHNTLLSAGQGAGGNGGIPSSFIMPDAILLEDVEMQSTRKPLTSQLPLIENPVGEEQQGKTINTH